MALIDDLTGLPNRRLLADRLSQNLGEGRRRGKTGCWRCLYIDIDGFQSWFNDSPWATASEECSSGFRWRSACNPVFRPIGNHAGAHLASDEVHADPGPTFSPEPTRKKGRGERSGKC